MALFIDGPSINVDTLAEYDASVLTVAATEGINLTIKIQLAQDAMEVDIERLIRRSDHQTALPVCTMGHQIGNVVWSNAMRIWQIYLSLTLTYRNAYYTQLNERYQAHAREYEKSAITARREFVEYGLGLVNNPLRRPLQPAIALVPSSETGGTYYFSVTYTDLSLQESSPSPVASVEVLDGVAADLTLTPPLSANATGWNLYGGTAPDQLFRQNDMPLTLNQDWAYLPSMSLTSGATPGSGQLPNQHWPLHRFLHRG